MIKNYLLVAWRGLRKNRLFSAINIFGLAIGLAVCLLIALFVTNEFSYDRYNVNANRIYRVEPDLKVGAMTYRDRVAPGPMAPVLAKNYPGVEEVVRIFYSPEILVRKGDQTLQERNAAWADPSLFRVFTLPMLAGDPKTALVEPNTIVISEKMAKKYFGSVADALGKPMRVDNVFFMKVTGVIRDMPEASHVRFNFIRSISTLPANQLDGWLNNSASTYVLLRPGVTQAQLNGYLREIVLKNMQPDLRSFVHASVADLEKRGDFYIYRAMPLTRIHLYSDLTNEIEPSGNAQYVYIFVATGILILLLACVNFMNLTTSRSVRRAREVGVRKVLGSNRGQLVWQFLIESLLTSALALGIGLLLATIGLPYLNSLAGTALTWGVLPWVWIGPGIIGLMAAVGVIGGSYPAVFLSAFRPAKVLKGQLTSGLRGMWLRNTLVVFQFTTAVILIIGTLAIYSQLRYIQNRKLGYQREQVVVIGNMGSLWIHARPFEVEVRKMPGVVSTSMASNFPTQTDWNIDAFFRDASLSASQSVSLGRWFVDANYIPTLGMEMAAGRNFSPLMPTDSGVAIINETAAKMMGFKDPLHSTIYQTGNTPGQAMGLPVIGVVKDFNAGSMRNKIPPMIFLLSNYIDRMAVRVKTEDLPKLLSGIEAKFHTYPEMGGQPFVYTFMDEDFNRLYAGEQRTGKLFLTFAVFAILIAGLGLFGLVSFAAEQRTREIGIRKVLGASVSGIIGLLSKELLRLVVLAVLVASPVAWWLSSWWLKGFAYQVTLSAWVFVLAAVLAVGIALATVGLKAMRAARANPVESLRSE